jgi:hypothetical protein
MVQALGLRLYRSHCHNGRIGFMERPMGLFGGWRLIDTAPLDTDVTLLVTEAG